jgi:glucose-6-phosphate isomerase
MSDLEAQLPEGVLPVVAEQLAKADAAEVDRRLYERDATLWGPAGTPEIADRLGWVTIAGRMLERVDELSTFAAGVRREGLEDVVLLGMGGSSLAPEVIRHFVLKRRIGKPR